jgi:hypothetical protein
MSARLWEACRLIAAGQSGPLLAEPELTDGSISHATLLERIARQAPGTRAPCYDVEMSLLRLAPGAGDAFWEQWDAVRSACSPGPVPVAAQARRMYEEGKQELAFEPLIIPPHGGWGTDAMVIGRLSVPSAVAGSGAEGSGAEGSGAAGVSRCWRLLTGTAACDMDFWAMKRWIDSDEWLAAVPFLSPHQPELIAANLLWRLSDGLRQRGRGSAAAIRGLADLSPAGPGDGQAGLIGHLALVAALSAANAGKRIAAAEAWTRWAADGRLNAGHVAGAVRLGVSESVLPLAADRAVFPLNRVAEALGYAITEPGVAFTTARCCLAVVAALLDERPAGLHLLLEVAARAAAISAVPELPAPVAALAAGKATTKLAEAARRLSQLTT